MSKTVKVIGPCYTAREGTPCEGEHGPATTADYAFNLGILPSDVWILVHLCHSCYTTFAAGYFGHLSKQVLASIAAIEMTNDE